MARLLSVNVGRALPSRDAAAGTTGIDKRPVDTAVPVRDPGPKGSAGSGLAGDAVCDLRHHGGSAQAVYAYAGEDLDSWAAELGRALGPGSFGENLTTLGLDVSGALVGERWRVGARCILQVTSPRTPCRTFAGWLGERNWLRRFTERRAPGAYLSVVEPGEVRAGDPIEVVHRPGHAVTVARSFAALTDRPELLPELLEAGSDLPDEERRRVQRHLARRAEPPAPG